MSSEPDIRATDGADPLVAGSDEDAPPSAPEGESVRTLLWTAATERPLGDVASLVDLLKRAEGSPNPGDEALRVAAVARPVSEIRQLLALLNQPPHTPDSGEAALRAVAVGRSVEDVAHLTVLLSGVDEMNGARAPGPALDTGVSLRGGALSGAAPSAAGVADEAAAEAEAEAEADGGPGRTAPVNGTASGTQDPPAAAAPVASGAGPAKATVAGLGIVHVPGLDPGPATMPEPDADSVEDDTCSLPRVETPEAAAGAVAEESPAPEPVQDADGEDTKDGEAAGKDLAPEPAAPEPVASEPVASEPVASVKEPVPESSSFHRAAEDSESRRQASGSSSGGGLRFAAAVALAVSGLAHLVGSLSPVRSTAMGDVLPLSVTAVCLLAALWLAARHTVAAWLVSTIAAVGVIVLHLLSRAGVVDVLGSGQGTVGSSAAVVAPALACVCVALAGAALLRRPRRVVKAAPATA